jgi:hypothetical protein
MTADVRENAPNWRDVEFFFRDGGTQYIELGCKDPYQRWCFPFLFLDTSDLEQAPQAADQPAEIVWRDRSHFRFQMSNSMCWHIGYKAECVL